MNKTIIIVEKLSKHYRLGEDSGGMYRYKTLQEKFISGLKTPFLLWQRLEHSKLANGKRNNGIWALREVSFTVNEGEVLGIVGRNGAGKSTLLKVLTRITEPSGGRARIRGRVASLLEVGTGFHPELTGRENIYLNGAILGMRRHEIGRKFDEIVSFAEVERFIDTPVKRYSSGMYVRLAFAVAAHINAEILLVDEVLAVGDAAFQQKCLGKMQEVSRSKGRTVLFVSHNMGAIESLCQSGIWLEKGQISFIGTAREAVSEYLHQIHSKPVMDNFSGGPRSGTGEARILRLRFQNDDGTPQTEFRMGEPLNIVIEANFSKSIEDPTVGVNILTDTGVMVADCRSSHCGLRVGQALGLVKFCMRIDSLLLYPRTYIVEPWISDKGVLAEYDWIHNAGSFVVTSGARFLSGAIVDSRHGISYIPTTWITKISV